MEAGEGVNPAVHQEEANRIRLEEQRAYERRPLGSRFQDTCRQTREGGGLPEGSIIPAGITHDLVLQFDLPARKMEREERLLAFNGGDVNATLLEICHEGGGKDARFLLAHGADANHAEEHVWPVIVLSAENGHVAVVEALLDAGAGELRGALARAASAGSTAVVALLLDHGADVHTFNSVALHNAVYMGHLETSTLLLDRGADPNARSSWDNRTPLTMARERGHLEVAALLLSRGAIDDAAA